MITETTIYDFCTSLYIPAIHKLAFNIPHVQILGMNHCGDSRQTAFKRHESFQYMLCLFDYADMLVASSPTKYNQNIIVEIDMCLLRVLHCNISVHYHRQK